jgi:hypothetical protein
MLVDAHIDQDGEHSVGHAEAGRYGRACMVQEEEDPKLLGARRDWLQ